MDPQPPDLSTVNPALLLGGLALVYIIFAWLFKRIADKTGTENSWWAWIPLLNILLLFRIAERPAWWILLLLIPFVNIVVSVALWMAICENRGKPKWMGLLSLIPVANFLLIFYLAFSD